MGGRIGLSGPGCAVWHAVIVSLAQRFWLILGAVLLATVLTLATLGDRLVPGAPPVPREPVRAGSGLGDSYLPEAGGAGYDVQHYDVRMNAVLLGDELRGTTTVTAVAAQDLDEFHLDLYLTARSVTVNGQPATFVQHGEDLAVTAARQNPAAPAIADGSSFTVTVTYDGDPGAVTLPGSRAHYRSGNDFVIAGEPLSAPLWYPANDHPRDPATIEVAVTVPRGREAVCAGRLIEHGPDPTRRTPTAGSGGSTRPPSAMPPSWPSATTGSSRAPPRGVRSSTPSAPAWTPPSRPGRCVGYARRLPRCANWRAISGPTRSAAWAASCPRWGWPGAGWRRR